MSADGAATAVPVAGDRATSPLPSSHSSASSFVGADVSDTYAEAMNVASVLVSVSKLKGKQDEVAHDSKDDTDEDTKKDKTSIKEKRESSETKSEKAEESRVDATAAATQDKLLRSLKSFLSRAGFIMRIDRMAIGEYLAEYSKVSEAALAEEKLDGEEISSDGSNFKLSVEWGALKLQHRSESSTRPLSPVSVLSFKKKSALPLEQDVKDRFCSCGEITGIKISGNSIDITFVHYSSAVRVVEDILVRGFLLPCPLLKASVDGVVSALSSGRSGSFLERRFVGGRHAPSMHKRSRSNSSHGALSPASKASSQEETHEPNDAATPSAAEASESVDAYTRLFVAHSKQVEPQVLVYLFSNRKGFEFIDVKRNHRTQRLRGFSFVTFKTHKDAAAALEALHGVEVDGRMLQIVPAEENESNGDDAASTTSQSSHRQHQKKKRKDGEYMRTSYARKQRAKTHADESPKGEDELVHSFQSSLMGFGGSPQMRMHPIPYNDPSNYAFPFSNPAPGHYPYYPANMHMGHLHGQQSPHAGPMTPMMHHQMPPIPPSPLHHQLTPPQMHAQGQVQTHAQVQSQSRWEARAAPVIDDARLYCTFMQQLPHDVLKDTFDRAAPGLEYISKQAFKKGGKKTYCFIKYADSTAAQLAMLRLNGTRVLDQTLNVTIAEPPRTPSGSSKRRKTINSEEDEKE